ncbi:MAG: pyrroline-5-carboxylate reductase dimerization domain-containing protein [Ignisphaera sp.]
MNIGIIGVGRLGTALVKGMIRGGIDPASVNVYDLSKEALDGVRTLGVNICSSAVDVYMRSTVIIVAVKPQDVINVIKTFPQIIDENKTVVSVAAFVPIKVLEKHLKHVNVYRAMPNIAVEVNKGFIALAPSDRINDTVEKLFKIVGDTVWVSEELLDLLTIVSASTPAIVVELIDAFILAALKAGVPYDIAKRAILSVFQGIGKLCEYRDLSSVRDSVITPRGTTISLVEKMYIYEAKSRLMKALIDSIEEYLDRLKKYRENIEN